MRMGGAGSDPSDQEVVEMGERVAYFLDFKAEHGQQMGQIVN
jgi:hypothetical protein